MIERATLDQQFVDGELPVRVGVYDAVEVEPVVRGRHPVGGRRGICKGIGRSQRNQQAEQDEQAARRDFGGEVPCPG